MITQKILPRQAQIRHQNKVMDENSKDINKEQ